jgi:hypothetical protein
MKLLDYYFQAFRKYREITNKNKSLASDRQLYIKSNPNLDSFIVKKYHIEIEQSWLDEIDANLEFIDNAIREDRQFIQSKGEVVPIEKVKKVSRESVVHLAKHSDLITHVNKDNPNDIIPDKIYMTEKLADYQVYENRFLYKVVLYLKEFISLRYSNINKLRSTYICDFKSSKEFVSKHREFKLDINFHDLNYQNEYPLLNPSIDKALKKMEDLLEIVEMYLSTPLLKEVSKSPIIKDPIVKTNVLRMDNNFIHIVSFYDYLTGYSGLGYNYEEIVNTYTPYTNIMADELSEVSTLLSFLTNMYGNQIEELLENNYLLEEQRLKKEESDALALRIKRLKKNLDDPKTLNDYILALEDRNKYLESRDLLALDLEKENANLKIENNTILAEQKILADRIKNYEKEIEELNLNHNIELNELNKKHNEEIVELNTQNASQIENITNEYESSILDLKNNHINELSCLEDTYKEKLLDLDINSKKIINEKEIEIENLNNNYKEKINSLENNLLITQAKLDLAIKDKEQIQLEYDAYRVSNGALKPSVELSNEERFTELEKEYDSFKKFFKEQWKITKKEIKKEINKK